MYVCLFLVLFYRGYSWMFMFFEFILKLNTYHLLYTFYTVVTHDYLEQLYLKWIYLMAVTYVVLTLCCLYLWWLFIVLLNLYYDYIVVMLYVLIYTIILCCPCYMPKYIPKVRRHNALPSMLYAEICPKVRRHNAWPEGTHFGT